MSRYQIIRIDVVTDCSGKLRPMLYFKPDTKIILQMQNNNNYLHLNIKDNDGYSGNMIPAVIDISSKVPSTRPNFFEACRYYCATLVNTDWIGLSRIDALGSFTVYDGVVTTLCWKPNGQCPSIPTTIDDG